MPRLNHNSVNRIKKQLVQTVSFQKMTKFAQRCFIRHCFRHEVNACECPHGVAVINGILSSRVGQVEPDLKQIHPQHLFNSHGRTTTLPFGIVRFNHTNPLLPRYDLVHDFKKFLSLGFLLAEVVFDIRKCFLLHFLAPPLL